MTFRQNDKALFLQRPYLCIRKQNIKTMKKIVITLLVFMTMMNTKTFAQSYGKEGPTLSRNALGLVYEGAIE